MKQTQLNIKVCFKLVANSSKKILSIFLEVKMYYLSSNIKIILRVRNPLKI